MITAPMTAEEFLRWDEAQTEKHEFLNGEIRAMAGARPRHEFVFADMAECLIPVKNEGCQWFGSNLRVKAKESYLYPDLTVACGPEFEGSPSYALLNPLIVVEILSPTTETYDRGSKSESYRAIPSLREYVLVHTARPKVELYRRLEEGWLLVEFVGEEAVLPLLSVGLTLPLRNIYARRIADGWADDPA